MAAPQWKALIVSMAKSFPKRSAQTGRDRQLDDFAKSAISLAALINIFSDDTTDALAAEGWTSNHSDALKAAVIRAAECAGKAKRLGRPVTPSILAR